MYLAQIGTAIKNPERENEIFEQSGVIFGLPYGQDDYCIGLADKELDKVLREGFRSLLGNRALRNFGFKIMLESPDLPLFVGARSIKTEPTKSGLQDVAMGVAIVTQSVVYEHRVILDCSRSSWDGAWDLNGYTALPPLDHSEREAQPSR